VLLANILLQESLDQLGLGAGSQVISDAFVLFLEALVSLLQISGAGGVYNQSVTLHPVVVGSLSQQHILELLLVYAFVSPAHGHVDQHVNR